MGEAGKGEETMAQTMPDVQTKTESSVPLFPGITAAPGSQITGIIIYLNVGILVLGIHVDGTLEVCPVLAFQELTT